MTRLSILILKSADNGQFEDTLASVLANRPQDCQVLAVCPGGYDDPYDLADEVTFIETEATFEPSQLVNIGLERLRQHSEFVHLIASGLSVEEGWTEAALDAFNEPAVGAVAPLVLRPDGKVAAAGMRLNITGRPRAVRAGKAADEHTSRSRILGPTLGAAFYRTSSLQKLPGLDPVYRTWLADADLALSLRAAGYRIVLASDSRLFGNLDLDCGLSDFRESVLVERLFWKHRTTSTALLLHPVAIGIEALGRLPLRSIGALAGRVAGLLQVPFDAWRNRSRSINFDATQTRSHRGPGDTDDGANSGERSAA